ncbi:MAG: TIM-barrel domain-containing protein, partial [Planctomycetota bacterium]
MGDSAVAHEMFEHAGNHELMAAEPVQEASRPLPPVRPSMRARHGSEQDRREATARWKADRRGAKLGDRVVRFRDPAAKGRQPANPFLVRQLKGDGSGDALCLPTPRFTEIASHGKKDTIGGYRACRIDIDPDHVSLYGTGEVPGSLLRNGTTTLCWNADAPAYSDETESLYQSHPWVLGVREDGSAFGVLAETTHACEIDLRRRIEFRSLGPAFSVIVIERDHPEQVVQELARLTGTIDMPPIWALGYHQCRWSYNPESRVREIAQDFREKQVPCDVIWFDIDYMDGFRVFTVDDEQFPDPKGLVDDLRADGFKAIWMIDPGVKVDENDPVYTALHLGTHGVKDVNGKPFHGSVWPGLCAFPDFLNARTRAWWAELFKDFVEIGVDGVWNDMNEPAVFGKDGQSTMPDDNWHDADEELGGPGDHAQHHNIYGMQMARATREGLLQAQPERRPFVLTRAGAVGSHRYAATWTGDNISDWQHLSWSVPMTLNLALSGQPFAGPDIGGF